MNFKVGDRVELKSGGPVMTVSNLNNNGTVHCIWFATVDASTPSGFSFHAETLKPLT
ncbi:MULTISPECIES: YodC family protein [unclassified Variovorax]|uniref:YodC family protein n=1 Tax=unclassified Variovorax TaxID=663243 RepID=UPI003F47DDF4